MTQIPPPKLLTSTSAYRALDRLAKAEKLWMATLSVHGDPTEAMLQLSEAKNAAEKMLRAEGLATDQELSMKQVGEGLIYLGRDQMV